MNKIKLFGILFVLTLISCSAFGQQRNDEQSKAGSFFAGGNLGLQFGTVTLIDMSPLVGYNFTEYWAVGIGATYKYYRYKLLESQFKSSYYGGSAFTRYHLHSESVGLLNHLFLHVEYELLNYRFNPSGSDNYENTKVESYFIGGGYSAPISNTVNANILLLYDLNNSANSPYDNPVIRVGLTVRL